MARQARSSVLITGGAGYVGLRLGFRLAEEGHIVTLLDLHPPATPLPPNVNFATGDIRNVDDVTKALKASTAGLVFHVASYGAWGPEMALAGGPLLGGKLWLLLLKCMSGRESMHWQLVYNVNVGGTANLLQACQASGTVRRLVYTSTYNVVFAGKPIIAGDEHMGYSDDGPLDAYSRSKALAERSVLAANSTPLDAAAVLEDTGFAAATEATPCGKCPRGGGITAAICGCGCRNGQTCSRVGSRMLTCAVRPAAIYGPGEQRHMPRVIQMVRAGLFVFTFGPRDGLVDWLHVDNLVSALILAAEGLTPAKECVAAGQAYFISDDCPVNNFEFFRPVLDGLGYPFPRINLPYWLVYHAAWAMELLCALLHSVADLTPILSRAEVEKCAVTHFFRVDKAKLELGYQPVAHPMEEVVQWYKAAGYGCGHTIGSVCNSTTAQSRSAADSRAKDTWLQRPLLSLLLLVALLVLSLLLGQWLDASQS